MSERGGSVRKIVGYLARSLAGAGIRVYGDTIPPAARRTSPLPPTVRIRLDGGPPRPGTLGLLSEEVSVDCFASDYEAAEDLDGRVRDALERIGQRTRYPEAVRTASEFGIKLARRYDGPFRLEDDEVPWPAILSTWGVDSHRPQPL